MLSWKHKTVLAVAAVSMFGASAPREADAFIFRWWRERCAAREAARVAYFAPTACGTCQPACNTCQPACPQQVCSYQPQTCYRTVVQQVPVTVFRPVTTVDPCTGCPSTTMQACTTTTTQVQRVPYTTMRQVCQMVQPQPTCNTCASPVVAQPIVQMQAQPMMMQQQQFAAPATPGCASCGTGYAPAPAAPMAPNYAQPYAAGPSTELAPQQPSTSLQPVPADQAPALQPNQSYYPGPTFPSNNTTSQYPSTSNYPAVTSVPSTSSGLYPVPATTPSTGTSYQPRVPASAPPAIRPLPDLDREEPAAPGLLNPQDRTAARELPAVGEITPISWQSSGNTVNVAPAAATQPVAAPAVKKWQEGAWRAAR